MKNETFLSILCCTSKPTSVSEHFEKKDEPHSLSTSEIMDCEIRG